MDPTELLTKFQDWFYGRNFKNVSLNVINSEPDSWYEVEVVYELKFTPSGKDKLSLKISIGKEGQVGFGIHRYGLLGFRLAGIYPVVFIAGLEPSIRKIDPVLKILEFVSQGSLDIRIRNFPIIGVTDAVAVISKDQEKQLQDIGVNLSKYGFSTSKLELPFQRTLKFEPWT